MRRYILPAIALILMALYFLPYLFGGSKAPGSLLAMEIDSIKEMLIKKKGVEIELKREHGQWQIVRPIKWRADSARVRRILEGLNEATLDTPVTSRKEDFPKYKISEEGDYLAVSDGNKTERIYIGKRGARYQLIYVRPEREKRVYLVKASFADWLPDDVNTIRDKTLVSLSPEGISHVFWNTGDSSYSVVKKGKHWYGGSTEGKESERLSEEKIRAYLEQFSSLEATGFAKDDRLPEKAVKTGLLRIIADKTYSFELYKKDSQFYLVKDSVPYRISEYIKNRIFKKPAD